MLTYTNFISNFPIQWRYVNCLNKRKSVNQSNAVRRSAVRRIVLFPRQDAGCDQHLKFDQYLHYVCKSAYYHIRALKHIRSSLSSDIARTLASALVNSRVNYANSVLYGKSAANISRLQRVQNAHPRKVTYAKRAEHIHPVLHNPHWLLISYRIEYKVAILAFKISTSCSQ